MLFELDHDSDKVAVGDVEKVIVSVRDAPSFDNDKLGLNEILYESLRDLDRA